MAPVELADFHHLKEHRFLRALRNGGASQTGYVGFLRVMAALHTALDSELRGLEDEPAARGVVALWRSSSRPLDALHQDLRWFRRRSVPDVLPALERALGAADETVRRGRLEPATLVGPLLVLESLRDFARSPGAAARLGGSGRGATYLAEDIEAGPLAARLVAARDATDGSPEVRTSGKDAAVAFAGFIDAALDALEPIDPDQLGVHVLSLNPAGGSHPVIQDLVALDAVLNASDGCLAEHPYFLRRFGDRGLFFTDSDGAWLATLASSDSVSRGKRIDWLARVLSARGIPSYLLQRHLEILADVLGQACPGRPAFATLGEEAERLAARSEATLPCSRRGALVDSFVANVSEESEDTAELGHVLVGAVIDESLGVSPRAVASASKWICGDEPSEWTTACLGLLSAARAGVP